MGCFKEIYTEEITRAYPVVQRGQPSYRSTPLGEEQTSLFPLYTEGMRLEIDPEDLEILLEDEKDEFTLSLFPHPEDTAFRRISLDLLS